MLPSEQMATCLLILAIENTLQRISFKNEHHSGSKLTTLIKGIPLTESEDVVLLNKNRESFLAFKNDLSQSYLGFTLKISIL